MSAPAVLPLFVLFDPTPPSMPPPTLLSEIFLSTSSVTLTPASRAHPEEPAARGRETAPWPRGQHHHGHPCGSGGLLRAHVQPPARAGGRRWGCQAHKRILYSYTQVLLSAGGRWWALASCRQLCTLTVCCFSCISTGHVGHWSCQQKKWWTWHPAVCLSAHPAPPVTPTGTTLSDGALCGPSAHWPVLKVWK